MPLADGDGGALALGKADEFRVASVSGEGDGFGEGAAAFPWGVGIRADGEGDACLAGEFEEEGSGVHFADVLEEAGGIQFDGGS